MYDASFSDSSQLCNDKKILSHKYALPVKKSAETKCPSSGLTVNDTGLTEAEECHFDIVNFFLLISVHLIG